MTNEEKVTHMATEAMNFHKTMYDITKSFLPPDLDYNVIYEMVIKKYRYKCIKSGLNIIYTIVSQNQSKTSSIMRHLSEDLGSVALSDKVKFYLDGKFVCEKTVDEVFNSKADPTTGMNIIAEEVLWMNNVDKDKVESIRDTLNEEIRRRHGEQ